MFDTLFKRALQISKAFGVITVLIGFPAAVLGAYRFSGEVYDTFTKPDVEVAFPRLTIRCFYRLTSQAEYEEYRSGNLDVLVENCATSRLAVSFAATFRNNDRVGRTITGVSVTLDLPENGPAIEAPFDHVWQVSHQIDGVIETNTRDPWSVTAIPAGAATTQELWLMQSAPLDVATSWNDVLAWLTNTDEPPENQTATATLTAIVSGHDRAFQCDMTLRPESLARFRSFDPINQLRFTGQCAAEDDA